MRLLIAGSLVRVQLGEPYLRSIRSRVLLFVLTRSYSFHISIFSTDYSGKLHLIFRLQQHRGGSPLSLSWHTLWFTMGLSPSFRRRWYMAQRSLLAHGAAEMSKRGTQFSSRAWRPLCVGRLGSSRLCFGVAAAEEANREERCRFAA